MDANHPVAVRIEHMRMGRRLSESAQWGLVIATMLSVLLVAMTFQNGSKLKALVPFSSLVWYLATLLICYWLHAPLLADGVVVPAISEMGVSTGRFMYRLGFGSCGFLLAMTLLQVHALFNRSHPSSAWETGLYWGLVSAMGIALQGVCTLRLTFGWETCAHFTGAALTMLGAMSHGSSCNDWFDSLPKTSPLLQRGLQSWGLKLRRDLQQAASHGTLVMFAIPLLLQAGKRLGMFSELNVLENCMGLMQWTLVAGIAIFFCSYAFDLC